VVSCVEVETSSKLEGLGDCIGWCADVRAKKK
jgi:hypothetical protein